MKQKLVHIILISFILPVSSIFALTFEEVDFEKLVLSHPLMQNYDDKTGYFHNTDYEIQDIEKLKKEVEELSQKIEVLNKQESNLASKSLNIEDNDEDNFWNEISNKSNIRKSAPDRSNEINNTKNQIKELKNKVKRNICKIQETKLNKRGRIYRN